MKRILALVLSIAMVAGFSMPALAETADQEPTESVVTEQTPEGTEMETADQESTESVVTEQTSEEAESEAVTSETAADAAVNTGMIGTETEEAPQVLTQDGTYTTGIYQVNGQYVYYFDGLRQYNTNVMKVNGIWYNLVNGVVTGNTVAKNSNGWWYINAAGQVDFKFNGIARNSNGWWYCKGGKVQFDVNDVLKTTCYGKTGWYNIRGGKLVCNTVAKNSNGWWYINKNGMVDFSYTGIGKNQNGSWYCKGGKVQFGYSGNYYANSTQYVIKKGKVTYSATTYEGGLCKESYYTAPRFTSVSCSGNKLYISGYYVQYAGDYCDELYNLPYSTYKTTTLTLSSSVIFGSSGTDDGSDPVYTKAQFMNIVNQYNGLGLYIHVHNGVVVKMVLAS